MVTRNNLGWMLWLQGRHKEAAEILLPLLADRRRILGDNHPDTLNTYHNIARVTASQGRYQEAGNRYRHVLSVRRQILGDNHPDTLTTCQEFRQLSLLSTHAADSSQATMPQARSGTTESQ